MTYWFKDPLVASFAPIFQSNAIRGLTSNFIVPKIFLGDNCLTTIPGLAPSVWDGIADKCPKKRAFIVTDEGAARYARKIEEVMKSRLFTVQVWDRVLPEVPLPMVHEGVKEVNVFQPDVIVGVGGGSALDASKAIFSLYERPDIADLGTIAPIMPLNLRKKAILVAVPTTSGTGSECTAAFVASDTAAHRKIPVLNPEYVPDYAILIPSFTLGMPPKLTAGTGLDALAHSTDCVTSPNTNDFCEPLALRAIELVFKWLPRAYHDGTDQEARARMHTAASIAGMAFGNGGVSFTHSMGHSLGHLFNLHHGIAVGVFIPYTLQFYSAVSDRYLAICDALRVKGRTGQLRLAALVEKFKGLMAQLDLPTDIKSMGISRDDMKKNMEKLVLFATEDPDVFQSPRPMTPEQCEKLFWYVYEGKDVDF